jgi:hypothetical protein
MKIFVAGATCAVGLPLDRPLGTLGHTLCTLGHQVTGMTRAVQFGQARPAYCVTILISPSPFDELIRSSLRRISLSEMMKRVMPCAPSTRSTSMAFSSQRTAATSGAVQSRDRETDRGQRDRRSSK